jgi:hypothetical protein
MDSVGDKALFLGTPLLSLPGKTYWTKDGHLLPAGFDFEFKNVSKCSRNIIKNRKDG